MKFIKLTFASDEATWDVHINTDKILKMSEDEGRVQIRCVGESHYATYQESLDDVLEQLAGTEKEMGLPDAWAESFTQMLRDEKEPPQIEDERPLLCPTCYNSLIGCGIKDYFGNVRNCEAYKEKMG